MGWIPDFIGRIRAPRDRDGRKNGAVCASHKNGDGGTITGDNPITRAEDDTLGRVGTAKSFAQQVLSLDTRHGIVVGVLGAWGSGKTSFINLARDEFRRVGASILDFNPWMFSGAEQLVGSFFSELAAQLRVKPAFAEIAKNLEQYGEAFSVLKWLPVVGPWVERGRDASKLVRRFVNRQKESMSGRRTRLESALADLSDPLVVVLDDIDRLSSSEIRDVFKLVRLTASFPNVIYILAFARSRVENALSHEGIRGRDYLEKILQVAIDLPAAPSEVMHRQVLAAIDEALSGIENPGPFEASTWPDIFMEIVRPLIRNMRDVRRYAAAIRGTVAALDGQIALADVLALEAIRTFLPDVHGQLHDSVEGLTTHSGDRLDDPDRLKTSIDALIAASDSQQKIVRSMVRRLFPGAERHVGGSHYGVEWQTRWLRERRVAHKDILRLYCERVAGDSFLAFTDAERAFGVMADQGAFETYLRSLDLERLEDVIASLEAFQGEFSPQHVVPGVGTLLNLLGCLPERSRSMFDLGPRMVVGRVTFRLLRSLDGPESVEAAVRDIVPDLTTLSARLFLIDQIGHREGVGHKLVSEEVAAEFEQRWRSDVRLAKASDLRSESDLVMVLLRAQNDAADSEPPLEIPDEPDLTLAMLRSARNEVKSQAFDSCAVNRSFRLSWDALEEVVGGSDVLADRIDRLKRAKQTKQEDVSELLSLAAKYLDGWRPED